MLRYFLWFLAGVWIGSLITLVMVALLRKNKVAPNPLSEKTAQLDGAVKTGKTYDAA